MLSSPSSSDSLLLDTYLDSEGSQAVKNIIRIGRALRLEDAVLCQLMESFDAYKTDCHVSAGTLERSDISNFLSSYNSLPENIKGDITREFLDELLKDDSVANRFNMFLSLLQAYPETIAGHQQAAAMLSSLQQKIRQKVSVGDRDNVKNLVLIRLQEKPQVMTRLTYLQALNILLNKARSEPDILALFFLEPFTFSDDILAKIKRPEDSNQRRVLENLIVQRWSELKAELSTTPRHWTERTWPAAKETYRKLEALADTSSADYQDLLQRVMQIIADETKQLFDLEKRRNLILRIDLNAKENFMTYLEALKVHTQWREDLPFEETKKNLQKQIQILEDFKIALKTNKEEGFLSFLQKQAPVLPPPKPTPSVTPIEKPIERISLLLEEKKPKPTFRARLKEYAPFILTGLAAFALSFYSTPLMLLTLVVGTGGAIVLQRRSKAPEKAALKAPPVEKPIGTKMPSAASPGTTPPPAIKNVDATAPIADVLMPVAKTHLVHPVPANEAQATLAIEREQRAKAALARLGKPNC